MAFSLQEKDAFLADLEGIVRRFGGAADFDVRFMNDIAIGHGVAGFVEDVPAEGFPEGIDELDAHLRFAVAGIFIFVQIVMKFFYELVDGVRR